jgi:hypothetical protein
VISLSEVAAGARLLAQLPSTLRRPLRPDAARTILRRRLERREDDFLRIARRGIFDHPPSVYRHLLRLAGCEYGDLVRLVHADGVEGALRQLLRVGVYLTVEEFKGRRPVRRGSASVEVCPDGLRNPLASVHISGETSGSRGTRAPVPIDVAWVRDWAVDECLDADARSGLDWIHGRWTVPGGASIAFILMFAAAGMPLVRWFSPIDPGALTLHPRYRWAAGLLHWGSRLTGVPLPRPEHVPFDATGPILEWLTDTLRSGAVPHLVAYTSGIVRVCQAARDAGIDLTGSKAMAAGEPLTSARLATIRRAGVAVTPIYASIDSGVVGKGCVSPAVADEVHVFHDLLAIIQPSAPDEDHGLPDQALLVSSLRDTAPLTLVNVSLGDQGTLTERHCTCPLEGLGWTSHLHTIRSFEKLSAGGMTFLDADLIQVIEEILPARFGGTPADYQLVEAEAAGGTPSLRLLVHPGVGCVDETAVVEAFLSAIGGGSGIQRVMGTMWRDARLLTVARRPPLRTPSGKILHLHVERGEARGASQHASR